MKECFYSRSMNILSILCLLAAFFCISPVTCQQRYCRAPTKTIQNGRRSSLHVNYFKVGSSVRYWCESGYSMRGSRYLKCVLRSGKAIWIGNIPRCVVNQNSKKTYSRSRSNSDSHSDSSSHKGRLGKVKQCPTHALNNGWVKLNYHKRRGVSLAQYYCKRGWVLQGRKKRVCLRNGVWIGSLPVCIRKQIKDCGDPGSPINGGRHLSSTIKGSIVKFYCKQHYKLIGCSKRLCTDKGWTGRQPSCISIQCHPLGNPKYGSVNFSGRLVSSIATYACNKGFKLYGVRVRKCLGTGGWTGKKPICRCNTCGKLPNPMNGFITFPTTKPGNKATYSCESGYALKGTRVRMCQRNCAWSDNEPTCERKFVECGLLQPPNNGQVIVRSRKPGSVAQYTCNDGYRIIGYDRRGCLESGVWSMEPPTCQAISCSSLNPPINGGVRLADGSEFGSSAVYYCFNGYELSGDNTRYCKADGSWSGIPPTCHSVDCGELPSPANGAVNYENTVFESVATYSCHPGFKIFGDTTRLCHEDGTWLGTMPSCKPIECDDLDDPTNGEVIYNSVVFNSTATYSCLTGFELVGINTRICKEDGEWSGDMPSCKIVDCGSLQPPVNGFVTFTNTEFESVASYSCREGYDLVGDATRLCEGNGAWSGDRPVCEAVDCGPLNDLINGEIDIEETTLGSVATYSCFIGYILADEESRVCLASGKWSGNEPICETVEGRDCGPLSKPIRGSVTLSGTSVGSRADYTCDEGYSFSQGNKQRFCQQNLHWSGEAAVCEVILCPNLENPQNGHVSFQSNTFGSEALYFCEPGFTPRGETVRICGSDRQWTGKQPTCELIDCGPLTDPLNGLVDVQSTSLMSVAQYTCAEGFELMGDSTRECMANGKWSGHVPLCIDAERCAPLINPLNGFVINDEMGIVGSTATYMCNFGFLLVGDSERVCRGAGSGWSGSEPSCQSFECPVLPNPPNGVVLYDERTVFSLATYSCNEGFFLIGLNVRECKPSGEWSVEIPVCQEIIDCGLLVDIEFGSVQFNDTTKGSVAQYQCQMGYTLSGGDKTRVCQDNRKWSGHEPVCSPVNCGSLTDPDNGRVEEDGIILGSTATYHCNEGFQLVGEDMRYCQANGLWAGNEPFCQAIAEKEMCDDPGVPANGVREGRSLTVGSVLFFRCNDGFIIMGSKVRVCQDNGVFSGMQPKCEPYNDHCQGSSRVIFDQCNRQCECDSKRLVKCSRLRRDWTELNTEDKLRYIQAVKTVATDKLYKPRYDALVRQYEESFDSNAQVSAPSISQFIPYNRYFLLQYENLLREIDCRITIPYWDWTAFPITPYQNPVWHNLVGFGNSSRVSDQCVSTGPFKFSEFLIPDGTGGYRCIRRDYNDNEFPRRELIERDILTLPAFQFNTLHQQLQLFIGTSVLCYVGGDLCSTRPAYDPVFLLHISHVDFIFDRWQRFGDGRGSVRYASDDSPLVFGRGLLVSDFSDNMDLPDDTAVSYGAPTFHKNHIPSFLLNRK